MAAGEHGAQCRERVQAEEDICQRRGNPLLYHGKDQDDIEDEGEDLDGLSDPSPAFPAHPRDNLLDVDAAQIHGAHTHICAGHGCSQYQLPVRPKRVVA